MHAVVLPETCETVEFYALRPATGNALSRRLMAALNELTTKLVARNNLSAGEVQVAVTLLELDVRER